MVLWCCVVCVCVGGGFEGAARLSADLRKCVCMSSMSVSAIGSRGDKQHRHTLNRGEARRGGQCAAMRCARTQHNCLACVRVTQTNPSTTVLRSMARGAADIAARCSQRSVSCRRLSLRTRGVGRWVWSWIGLNRSAAACKHAINGVGSEYDNEHGFKRESGQQKCGGGAALLGCCWQTRLGAGNAAGRQQQVEGGDCRRLHGAADCRGNH